MVIALLHAAVLAQSESPASDPPIPSPSETAPDDLSLDASPALAVRRFAIAHDNDGWIIDRFNPEDRHYTGGAHVLLGFDGRWADWVGARLPFAGAFGPGEFALGGGARLMAFTPNDIEAVEPDPDDRPYAGYLTSTFYAQRRKATTEDHFQLDLGIIGPSSLAEGLQESIHESRGSPEPRGWHTQLPDEFAFNARIRKTWRVQLSGVLGDGFATELLPDVSTDLGNVYLRGSLGLTLRAGFNLPDDFGTPRIDDPGSVLGGWTGAGIYGFARAQTQVVGFNAFLDGTAFHDSRSVEREPFVHSIEVGGVWNIGGHFGWRDAELQYSWTALTDEFETDDLFDSYATIQLRMGF